MQRNLERVLNLIKKTGDKIVIVDKNSDDEAWMVMSIDDYEEMVNGSEWEGEEDDEEDDDLTDFAPGDKIDEINEDIAFWREKEGEKEISPILAGEKENEEEQENQFYFEPVE